MISVIVPVYNGEAVLSKTVPAVLALEGVDEWVWVDDGSTDQTHSLLKETLRDRPRARIVNLSDNGGRGAARNAGAKASTGDHLLFFDADVEPRPEAVLRFREALTAPETVAAVAHVDSVLNKPEDPYQRYLRVGRRGPRSTSGPLSWRFFLSGACALEREVFERVGGFDEGIAYGEDFDLACRLSRPYPGGLRLARTTVAVHGVGTLDTAIENVEAFGRAMVHMQARCPEAFRLAAVPRGAARLAPFAPSGRHLIRIVRALPSLMQPRAVRLVLGLSLLHGLGRA